jgi:hypothetical protein
MQRIYYTFPIPLAFKLYAYYRNCFVILAPSSYVWQCALHNRILSPTCRSVVLRREFCALYVEVWTSEGNSAPYMWKCGPQDGILGPICGNVNLRREFYALYVEVWT